MKNNRKIWMRIAQVCGVCMMSLLLFTACAKGAKEPEKTEKPKQEENQDKQDAQENNAAEQEPQKEPEVLETIPEGLEELHFIDFGIENGEYGKGTYKGEYGGTTLDDTLVCGKLTFTPRGDTHVLIGGKKPMGGFGISALVPDKETEWVLRLYDTNVDKKGWKFDPIYFYSDVAGVPLVGQELDFKVSIQYVDNDGDGVENDVKLGMWFNDKLYDNKYIYLKDYESLSYSMGTWMTLVIFQDAKLFIN